MYTKKTLIDNDNNKISPIVLAKTIYMSDGITTLEEYLNDIHNKISRINAKESLDDFNVRLVRDNITLKTTYKNKIFESVIENPNIAKYNYSQSTLTSPTNNWDGEFNNDRYYKISKLDGVTFSTGSPQNNIPQHLFSIDLIHVLESYFGVIGATDKVSWCKNGNISKILCQWWGYGVCPSGNKAILKSFNIGSSIWSDMYGYGGNLASSPSEINQIFKNSSEVASFVDSNGFVHFNAYTDASDASTTSTIYSDFININITLTIPSNKSILIIDSQDKHISLLIDNSDGSIFGGLWS